MVAAGSSRMSAQALGPCFLSVLERLVICYTATSLAAAAFSAASTALISPVATSMPLLTSLAACPTRFRGPGDVRQRTVEILPVVRHARRREIRVHCLDIRLHRGRSGADGGLIG